MNIAVMGSGGREHTIAWKLSQDSNVDKVYTIPGNGGTDNNVSLDINNFEAIKIFCTENGIELLFVGPEAPLAAGIVDYFEDTGIKVFGPDKEAAKLEGSKIYAKNFMTKYNVKTAEFEIFENDKNPDELIRKLNGNLVVKYDGLAAGKGVFVCSSVEEAHESIKSLKTKYGNNVRYIVEQKLTGQEISIIGFTDGKSIKLLLPSQDHKPAYDGDKGPNTGGMGAFCPVPFCDENLIQKIYNNAVNPTLNGIRSENLNYRGVIYFGLMVDNNDPYVLEYNVRLGDPETEVILPALKSSLLELILACYDDSLDSVDIAFNDGYFVDVVLASGGYPGAYEKQFEIDGLEDVDTDCLVFHAGTKRDGSNVYTYGGRVINVVCQADDLQSAINKVYENVKKISFKNCFYRNDIGSKGISR